MYIHGIFQSGQSRTHPRNRMIFPDYDYGSGIFPPDLVKPWLPEVQANVAHLPTMTIPTAQVRVPPGYLKHGVVELAPIE